MQIYSCDVSAIIPRKVLWCTIFQIGPLAIHTAENLAVLCLHHHDKAHTTSELTRNLDLNKLKSIKSQWEKEVCSHNAEAILQASRLDYDAWWYFNHTRLFELANVQNIRFTDLSNYYSALKKMVINHQGLPNAKNIIEPHMYSGYEGLDLYGYVREVMEAVLENLPAVFNISDFLDRSIALSILKPGDFIFVQGAHVFSGKRQNGKGQLCTGKRRANNVEVSYIFDRWEATSLSAWGGWLSGRHDAASLVRVVSVQKVGKILHVESTVIAISSSFEGMKKREYANLPYRR